MKSIFKFHIGFIVFQRYFRIFASSNEYTIHINEYVMDNNFKQKIDALVTEICTVTDLTHKVEILNYMEQQSSFMLWQLEDEQRIDEDSRDY